MLLACSNDKNILIMGDCESDMHHLSNLLQSEGFAVTEAPQAKLGGQNWDVVLLSLTSPRREREVLRQLTRESTAKVFVLSAGDLLDRVMALEMGASDCLTVPWDSRELAARITLMFRTRAPQVREERILGDLTIYDASKVIFRGEERLELTAMEYQLLITLLRVPGQVISREMLSEEVFDRPFSPTDRSIDMHISRLRQKLGPHPDGSERIRTARSEGYTYTAPLPETAVRPAITEKN